MFLGLFRVRRFLGRLAIFLLALFCALNWFARQPYQFQQRFYSRLPQSVIYKLYHFSNLTASMTDFAALTGSDCAVDYTDKLPVEGVVCGGLPCDMRSRKYPAGTQYLRYTGFTVCYVPELRHPLWVAFKIPNGERKTERSRPGFKHDPAARNCPVPDDYRGSGYDRGHMAPNHAIAACYGSEAQRESFLLSNICPQRPGLNRGAWRRMEHLAADIWPELFGQIYVITGAHIGENGERLKSNIHIPEGFYKILVARRQGKLYALAVYMKQSTGYGAFPRTKIVSIDRLEEMTGLDFLHTLPDNIENRIESEVPTRLWPAGWRGCVRLVANYFNKLKRACK
jgi:endonuclease G, mitochondrial